VLILKAFLRRLPVLGLAITVADLTVSGVGLLVVMERKLVWCPPLPMLGVRGRLVAELERLLRLALLLTTNVLVPFRDEVESFDIDLFIDEIESPDRVRFMEEFDPLDAIEVPDSARCNSALEVRGFLDRLVGGLPAGLSLDTFVVVVTIAPGVVSTEICRGGEICTFLSARGTKDCRLAWGLITGLKSPAPTAEGNIAVGRGETNMALYLPTPTTSHPGREKSRDIRAMELRSDGGGI